MIKWSSHDCLIHFIWLISNCSIWVSESTSFLCLFSKVLIRPYPNLIRQSLAHIAFCLNSNFETLSPSIWMWCLLAFKYIQVLWCFHMINYCWLGYLFVHIKDKQFYRCCKPVSDKAPVIFWSLLFQWPFLFFWFASPTLPSFVVLLLPLPRKRWV